jgi:hypothetical protein
MALEVASLRALWASVESRNVRTMSSDVMIVRGTAASATTQAVTVQYCTVRGIWYCKVPTNLQFCIPIAGYIADHRSESDDLLPAAAASRRA